MNSFEFNKIAAGILISLLIAMVASMIGHGVIPESKLEKNVFVIDVQEEVTPASGNEEKGPADIAPLLVKADISAGEKIAIKQCGQCHTFTKGGPHKVGPNLWGIVGAQFAHAADYAYSSVFKEKQGKEHWSENNLSHYLYKPRAFMQGTKMAFAGLKKDEDRANTIAYLKTLKE